MTQPSEARSSAPTWLFVLELAYVALLVALALAYADSQWLQRYIHDPEGPLPLSVPWWGALGGVTISLTGVFKHASTWRPDYEKWHIARPVLGAVVGSVGCLIFIVVIRATGNDATTTKPSGGAVLALVAFLVGYREEIFRELIKRATDSLFARRSEPADTKAVEQRRGT